MTVTARRLLLVAGAAEVAYALVAERLFFLAGGILLIGVAIPSIVPDAMRARLDRSLENGSGLMAVVIPVAIVVPILLLVVDVASRRR